MSDLVVLPRRAMAAIPVEEIRKGPRLRPVWRLSALVALLWFGGFGGWAAVATLDSAAVAGGALVSEGHRKAIQHLDGGIVRSILVRDGDRVAAGDVLIRLDETRARADAAILESQYLNVVARLDRLEAEMADAPEVRFDAMLLEQAHQPEVAAIIDGQIRQFQARRIAFDGQIDILSERIRELGQEIAALEAQERAIAGQIPLVEEELNAVRGLVNKGLETKPRLLALERKAIELEGARGELQASVSRVRQSIGTAELQKIDLANTRRKEISAELEMARQEHRDLHERLIAAREVLSRTVIRAPLAGTVVGLSVFTEGGVVRPGETIMEIVPEDDLLIADVRVSPGDIDTVRSGLTAQVRLLSYSQRTTPTVTGTVQTVSADRLVDPATGEVYYGARILLTPEEVERLAGIELQAGMPVQAMIQIGERTVFDYLVAPLTRSLDTAFREE